MLYLVNQNNYVYSEDSITGINPPYYLLNTDDYTIDEVESLDLLKQPYKELHQVRGTHHSRLDFDVDLFTYKNFFVDISEQPIKLGFVDGNFYKIKTRHTKFYFKVDLVSSQGIVYPFMHGDLEKLAVVDDFHCSLYYMFRFEKYMICRFGLTNSGHKYMGFSLVFDLEKCCLICKLVDLVTNEVSDLVDYGLLDWQFDKQLATRLNQLFSGRY